MRWPVHLRPIQWSSGPPVVWSSVAAVCSGPSGGHGVLLPRGLAWGRGCGGAQAHPVVIGPPLVRRAVVGVVVLGPSSGHQVPPLASAVGAMSALSGPPGCHRFLPLRVVRVMTVWRSGPAGGHCVLLSCVAGRGCGVQAQPVVIRSLPFSRAVVHVPWLSLSRPSSSHNTRPFHHNPVYSCRHRTVCTN